MSDRRTVQSLVAERTRDRDTHQRQVLAQHQALEQARRLQSPAVRELSVVIGPEVERLILALHDLAEASHPLRGAPVEDTARVSNANSVKDEGRATRRYRRGYYRRRLRDLAETIEADLGGSAPARDRRYSAHVRWHTDQPKHGCPWCR